MAKKTTRPRVKLGDKPTPPPTPTKPRKPRSTSAKQGGQAAKKVTAPRPKPAPKPKPSLGQAIKQSAVKAAKSTIKVTPAGKAGTVAAGALAAAKAAAVKIGGGGAAKATSKELVKRPGALVLHPTKSTRAITAANKNMTRNRAAISIGGGATAAAYGGATAKYRARTGTYPWASPAKTQKTTPVKKTPGMGMSAARQEVALTKRAQERKQVATTGTAKKVTKKQTAYRQTRRWGTSKEAFQLSKANRNRPRG